jgi:hypothetical protein
MNWTEWRKGHCFKKEKRGSVLSASPFFLWIVMLKIVVISWQILCLTKTTYKTVCYLLDISKQWSNVFVLTPCLRRLTFFQQQKKVSKKCRPSSAGRADFPQITSGDAWGKIACKRGGFLNDVAPRILRGKSEVVRDDGVVSC